MGYVDHQPQGNGKYCYISKGKIVTYIDGKRTERSGLSAHLQMIDLQTDTYNGVEYESIVLFMQDDDESDFVLTIRMNNGYGQGFCKMIKNCDLKRPMEISASLEKDPKNPERAGFAKLFIKQPDNSGKWTNVKWAYTEKEPGKMPQADIIKVNGLAVKDYTKRNDFFRRLLVDHVFKQLKKLNPAFDIAAAKAKKETVVFGPEDIGDLPF